MFSRVVLVHFCFFAFDLPRYVIGCKVIFYTLLGALDLKNLKIDSDKNLMEYDYTGEQKCLLH